jgi:hypothetical protein
LFGQNNVKKELLAKSQKKESPEKGVTRKRGQV